MEKACISTCLKNLLKHLEWSRLSRRLVRLLILLQHLVDFGICDYGRSLTWWLWWSTRKKLGTFQQGKKKKSYSATAFWYIIRLAVKAQEISADSARKKKNANEWTFSCVLLVLNIDLSDIIFLSHWISKYWLHLLGNNIHTLMICWSTAAFRELARYCKSCS